MGRWPQAEAQSQQMRASSRSADLLNEYTIVFVSKDIDDIGVCQNASHIWT